MDLFVYHVRFRFFVLICHLILIFVCVIVDFLSFLPDLIFFFFSVDDNSWNILQQLRIHSLISFCAQNIYLRIQWITLDILLGSVSLFVIVNVIVILRVLLEFNFRKG